MFPGVVVAHDEGAGLLLGLVPDSVVLKRTAQMSRPCQPFPMEKRETSLGLALARASSAVFMRS